MSIFDDMGRFLEERLDEFLKAHPHLELQVLEEKLKEQELDTQRLLQELKREEKQAQDAILATAEDVQRWHERIQKAKKAGRQDLAQAAQDREAGLLRQGNQQWGHMEMVKTRMQQTQAILQQIKTRRQEVQTKRQQQQTRPHRPEQAAATQGWYQPRPSGVSDPLEEKFRQWEVDEDLEQLKRNMG